MSAPTGNTASHFTADLAKLQKEVDSDPTKAKDTIKHVFGITPGTAGESTQASHTALKALFEACYDDTSTLFPVGLASKCVGCITVVKSTTGNGYSLKHVVAPSPVYPKGNALASKAYGLVGLSGVDCYTRGGTTVDLSDMAISTFFTKLSYSHALNRLRSCKVPWSRAGSVEVKKHYNTIFKQSSKIHKAKSHHDEFLVTDSNQSQSARAGTVVTAALPVFFPIAATADFAFMSEVAIPTSITSGTDSDQDKAWQSFKDTLIASGCRKESVLLDDPFFQLWMRAVVTSPSIFAADWIICNYDNIDSQDAQKAVLQTMLKTKLDSLWCHNEDKRVEAYLLLLYAHDIGRPFTMEDWGDEMELQADNGKVHTLEREWWTAKLEDLPEALESGEHHSNDVLSPAVDKHEALRKRKAEFLQQAASKQPRSILDNITPMAAFPQIFPGPHSGQAQTSSKVDPIKTTFSAITDRNLCHLFAYPLKPGYNYDHYLTLHDLNGEWTIHDGDRGQKYTETSRLFLLPGRIKDHIRMRGPDGMSHHRSILDCNPASRLNHAELTKEDFYCANAFGLFLKGDWEKDVFGHTKFTGFTPLMCLLLLPYCEKEVVNGVAQPLMPPSGFKTFNDILTFLDAIIESFSHFVDIKQHHHGQLPLLLYEYSRLVKALESCTWRQAWNTLNLDKPQLSIDIMTMVHNIFARSAFHADQTGSPTKLLELDTSLGGNKWAKVIPSMCDFGSTTIDRYGLSDAFRGETETLFKKATDFLHTTMWSEVKPLTVITHWSFKPIQANPSPKQKGTPSKQFVPRDKPTVAPPTKVILRKKASVQELRDRFGPGHKYSNKNAPRAGQLRDPVFHDPIRSKFSRLTGSTHSSLRKGIHYAGRTTAEKYKDKLRFPSSIPVTASYSSNHKLDDEELDDIPGELIMHFCWDHFTSDDKQKIFEAAPVMRAYQTLRVKALNLSQASFREVSQPLDPAADPSIDNNRVAILSQLLLLCHFDFSLLVKQLRGPYVADYLDFQQIDSLLEELQQCQVQPGEPIHDFERIAHQLHHGFPKEKEFRCKREDVFKRNLYDNHSSIGPHQDLVRDNIAKDIQKSFVLCFHSWIFRFIAGLHLSPLGVLIKERYGVLKYRQLNDLSTLILGAEDTGAPNSQLDKKNVEEVPPVYYGNAFTRLCQRVWNLHISYPDDVIYIYKDDIVSAFRRCKYNPAIAMAYAYVFQDLLCIPLGALFGPRDSPGWFCMLSELRAFASTNLKALQDCSHPLSDSVEFDDVDEHPVAKAISDSLNQGIDHLRRTHFCFVDDTMMAEIKKHIRLSAAASIISAEIIFGKEPDVDAPVSKEKFMKLYSNYCDCLGIDVDGHRMLVIYPFNKREALCIQVNLLVKSIDNNERVLVKDVAIVLGKLRHAAQILPAGNFLCFHLQESLNRHLESCGVLEGWRRNKRLYLYKGAKWALRLIHRCLQDKNNPVWTRPLGLLIPRDPHGTPYSDASTSGLGGFCYALNFQWRYLVSDLLKGTAFKPKERNEGDEAHINVLKFVAIIINIYLSLLQVYALKKYSKNYQFDQGLPCERSQQREGGRVIPSLKIPYIERRFQNVFGSQTNSSLDPAAQAYCLSKTSSLLNLDRGTVRENNERTAAGRRHKFKEFCSYLNFHDLTFSNTSQADREQILTTFTVCIADGTLLGSKVAAVTVKNYVRAASEFATDDNYPDPRFRYDFRGNKIGGPHKYFPGLKHVYSELEKWKKAKAEGLPLTLDMLIAIIKEAQSSPQHSEKECIQDSTLLGIYTGSRCGEYCKGSSQPFNKVPRNPQTEDTFAGWPIAFTVQDFQFLSKDLRILHWTKVNPSEAKVRIRFRYDKGGGRNFSERTFAAINTKDELLQFFCPVRTCIHIIQRWTAINGQNLTPVFCYLNGNKKMTYLTDSRVNLCYRGVVKKLYPDKSHLFHQRIKDFRTHSVRITACLLLKVAGYQEHVIEFALRWASNAWKSYLREHLDSIQSQTDAVFRSAITQGTSLPAIENIPPLTDEPPFDTDTDDGK